MKLLADFGKTCLFSFSDLTTELKYDNFDFSSHSISFGVTLLCAFLGVFVAIVINLLRNITSGKAVRALLKSGANTSENAQTPKQLGFDGNIAIRFALREGAYLRNLIFLADTDVKTNKIGMMSKEDFSDVKLYIPEEKSFKASEQYKRRGNDLPAAIFATVILAVTFFLVLYQLPNLLEFLDSIIG